MSGVAQQAPPEAVARAAADFPILRAAEGRPPLCYLDSAATAQKPEPVLRAIDSAYREHYANIHRGVYRLASEATEAFEGARSRIAAWIGGAYEETIFTANVTAAINLVAYAWGRANVGEGDLVVLTEMEHHSNIVPWQLLAQDRGAEVGYVRVQSDGTLDLDSLDELLRRGPKLVGVAHVSNVLGTINPVAEISRRAHEAGALVLVDGAQAAPQLGVDVAATGADFYGFTGHKLYGPTGVGVLWARRELLEEMPPFLGGGDMIRTVGFDGSTWNDLPWKFEAGTSPFVQATALGAAVDWIEGIGMDTVREHERDLTAYALERLAEVPGLTIYGPPSAADRGAVISFSIDGVHPHDVAEILGRDEVCVRAGHHCAMPLMRCLGVPATARASFAVHNTREDVDRLIAGLGRVREVFELD